MVQIYYLTAAVVLSVLPDVLAFFPNLKKDRPPQMAVFI